MNTLATYQPISTAPTAGLPGPFLSTLVQHRAKMRVWAFSAAVRLSDQDKPIVLKLLVELAIILRMLALLAQTTDCATVKSVVVRPASRPSGRVAAHGGKLAKRRAAVRMRPVHVAPQATSMGDRYSRRSAQLIECAVVGEDVDFAPWRRHAPVVRRHGARTDALHQRQHGRERLRHG